MFGEADYTIVARIEARDVVDPATDSASRKLDQVERRAARTGRSITSHLGRAFAMLGGAYGLTRLARGIVGIQSELQEAQIGLAALFNAQTGMGMVSSLKLARGEIAALRRDAAAGVGEFGDYRRTYQMILAPSMAAGADTSQIRSLVRTSLAAGMAMEGERGMTFMGMDLVQALTRGASDRETRLVTNALRSIGMDPGEFNKLGTSARMDTLMQAFGQFKDAADLMGQGWSAQMGTFRDHLKNIALTLTEPLFSRWTEQLRSANDWLEANSETLQRIAEHWGVRLVRVWETLVDHAGTYAAIVAGVSVARVGIGAGMGVATAAKVGGTSGVMGALGLGGLGALGTALPAVGVALVAVGALAGGVMGALRDLPQVGAWISGIIGEIIGSLWMLGDAFGSLFEAGTVLNMAGLGLIFIFGGLLIAVNWLIPALSTVIRIFGLFLGLVADGILQIGAIVSGDIGKARAIAMTTDARMKAAWADIDSYWAENKPPEVPGEGEDGQGSPTTPNNNTYIDKVEVKVDAEVNADPARVAVAWSEILEKVERHRKQPRRTGLIPAPV